MRTSLQLRARHQEAWRSAIIAAGAVLASSCGPPPMELAALLAQAGAHNESAEFDVGRPGARPYLIAGWSSRNELWMDREDESFVWGLVGGPRVEMWILHPKQRTLSLRLRPHTRDSDIPLFDNLYATVNGNPLPPVAIRAGWQELEFPVPERFQHIGPNVVALGYDGPPGEPTMEADPATFRIAVDWIRLSDLMVTALPRQPTGNAAELVLPYLSAADYVLTLNPGASIDLGSVRAYGRPIDGVPRLLVRIATAAGTRLIEMPIPADEFLLPPPIPIDAASAGEVRISLIAMPPGSYLDLAGHEAEQDAGIRLVRPQIRDGR